MISNSHHRFLSYFIKYYECDKNHCTQLNIIKKEVGKWNQ